MDGNCLGWDCSVAGQAGYRGKYGGIIPPGAPGFQIFFGILARTTRVVIAANSGGPVADSHANRPACRHQPPVAGRARPVAQPITLPTQGSTSVAACPIDGNSPAATVIRGRWLVRSPRPVLVTGMQSQPSTLFLQPVLLVILV